MIKYLHIVLIKHSLHTGEGREGRICCRLNKRLLRAYTICTILYTLEISLQIKQI